MSTFGDKQKNKKTNSIEGLRKYAIANQKNYKKKKEKEKKSTIDSPKHVQQARQLAMSNPVGSMVEGGRVIVSGISKKLKKKNKA